jgi:hypothetical protein
MAYGADIRCWEFVDSTPTSLPLIYYNQFKYTFQVEYDCFADVFVIKKFLPHEYAKDQWFGRARGLSREAVGVSIEEAATKEGLFKAIMYWWDRPTDGEKVNV